MKKIMFSDKYGLTDAVLSRIKTMTRRIVFLPKGVEEMVHKAKFSIDSHSGKQMLQLIDNKGNVISQIILPYQIGEVVAVAQSYKDINLTFIQHQDAPDYKKMSRHCRQWGNAKAMAGWTNKMFVCADLMPHRIRFTHIKFESMRDISDADCFAEGIAVCKFPVYDGRKLKDTLYGYTVSAFVKDIAEPWAPNNPLHFLGDTPQTAFIVLLSKFYGKEILESNPFVVAYTFNLLD